MMRGWVHHVWWSGGGRGGEDGGRGGVELRWAVADVEGQNCISV